MRILALTKYGAQAASTRQRFLQYRPFLALQGISLDVHPLVGDDEVARILRGDRARPMAAAAGYLRRARLLRRAGEYDLVWIAYETFPYLPGLFERLAFRSGRPVVVDFDDAIFHQYDRHRNRLVRALLRTKLSPLLARAALVTCGNDYLRDYAERHGARALVIPTVVDTDLYRPAAKPPGAGVVGGWIGSPSTWGGAKASALVVAHEAARAGGNFLAIGGGRHAQGLADITARDWREEREIADLQEMDFGVMPVPDESWARGKCGYKLIQYMACGLPVIASPVGVNREIVIDGENGFLASDEAQWRAATARLLADRDLRAQMGARGRTRVIDHYSLAVQAPRLLQAFQSLRAQP